MKKTSTLWLMLLTIMLTGCSKDFLKSYDKRIIGSWRITDVDKIGIGGSNDIAFTSGTLTFYNNGTLEYVYENTQLFEGQWNIQKKHINEEVIHGLQISVVNYTTQELITQYYDDITFKNSTYFKADIRKGTRLYRTHFRK